MDLSVKAVLNLLFVHLGIPLLAIQLSKSVSRFSVHFGPHCFDTNIADSIDRANIPALAAIATG